MGQRMPPRIMPSLPTSVGKGFHIYPLGSFTLLTEYFPIIGLEADLGSAKLTFNTRYYNWHKKCTPETEEVTAIFGGDFYNGYRMVLRIMHDSQRLYCYFWQGTSLDAKEVDWKKAMHILKQL